MGDFTSRDLFDGTNKRDALIKRRGLELRTIKWGAPDCVRDDVSPEGACRIEYFVFNFTFCTHGTSL